MLPVRRRQSSRLCAAVAPAALFPAIAAPTTTSSWKGRHARAGGSMGSRARGGSLDRRRRANGAPGKNARGSSPDGREHADDALGGGGRVDRDRGLYRRRGSPSPDRYHGHRGAQAVVRDIGPDGGWPTLTKTNYVEWAAVMRVRLQVRHMWEAVWYGVVDYYEDRWALDAVFAFPEASCQRCSFRFRRSGLPRKHGTHRCDPHRQRPCPQDHTAGTSQGVREPGLQAR
jgi:hypothetical protein